jgi:subtilisin family serine protease
MTDGDDDIIEVPWDNTAWERAILARRDIGRLGDRGDVLYTPGRLLVDSAAAKDKRVMKELRRRKARISEEEAGKVVSPLGLTLYTIPDDQLVGAVRAIRDIVPGAASLDHVWLPSPQRGHGGDPPVPTGDPGAIPGADLSVGKGLTIFVLDTGIAGRTPIKVQSRPGGLDAEVPDEDGDKLRDHAAGHGTHVAGLIARTAPGAQIVARRLLKTPVGMTTEIESAQAIVDAGKAGAHLINGSFGGATLFDAPPLVTERALATLAPGTVVVASAGNNGSERPSWPAACKGVVAVAAVGAREPGSAWLRTDFTNYGRWVDCCAPGVAVASTFLVTRGLADKPPFKGFAKWSGTSFACPQVTAAIAALATRDGIDPALAVYRLVHDPARPRIPRIGALVDPDKLP